MINMNYIKLVSLYLREEDHSNGLFIVGSVKEYILLYFYIIVMVQKQEDY